MCCFFNKPQMMGKSEKRKSYYYTHTHTHLAKTHTHAHTPLMSPRPSQSCELQKCRANVEKKLPIIFLCDRHHRLWHSFSRPHVCVCVCVCARERTLVRVCARELKVARRKIFQTVNVKNDISSAGEGETLEKKSACDFHVNTSFL